MKNYNLYNIYSSIKMVEKAFYNEHFELRTGTTSEEFFTALAFSNELHKVFKNALTAYQTDEISWKQFDWLTEKSITLNNKCIAVLNQHCFGILAN